MFYQLCICIVYIIVCLKYDIVIFIRENNQNCTQFKVERITTKNYLDPFPTHYNN